MQSVLDAMVTHLKTVSAITDLTSTRIFGGELPDEEVDDMPRAVVVLRYAGGFDVFRTHREQEPRLNIFSYGDGYKQADQVDRAVADALIVILRLTVGSTLIYSVGYSGGPQQLKEPDTGWRYSVRSAIVKAGETALT